MLLNILGIFAGLALLVVGADRFVQGSADISRYLGMPPLIIGLVIVGLGTSAPELLVGSVAALEGKTEISIGNALGSNIANIGLVLGLSVIYRPVTITSRTLKREYLIMLLAIVAAGILLLDRNLSRLDGVLLLFSIIIIILVIIKMAERTTRTDPLAGEFEKEYSKAHDLVKSIFWLIAGLVVLLGGAELLVRCAIIIARHIGISDLVIGLTIIAIGTSLPEVAASITSIIKNEADIAVGNVIGSNMFNMLAVIGVPALIHPVNFDILVLYRDFPVMIALTLLMGWMIFVNQANRFTRAEGTILLLCFTGYQVFLFT